MSPWAVATMSGVLPRLSGLSTHLPSLSSSFTAATSRASTAVMRSLYFGPEPSMKLEEAGDGCAARTTLGAGACFCFAAAVLGFADSLTVLTGSGAALTGSVTVFTGSTTGFGGSATAFAASTIGAGASVFAGAVAWTFAAAGASTFAGAGALATGAGAGFLGATFIAGAGRVCCFTGSYCAMASMAIFSIADWIEGSTTIGTTNAGAAKPASTTTIAGN